MCRNKKKKALYNNKGFTLVEILVSLVILLLVVMAVFPLFTLATKVTNENRARMIASQLAKSELERTLALVTATNYVMEDGPPKKAPLKSGVYEYYLDNDGEPTVDEEGEYVNVPDPRSRYAAYQIKRIVQWVDDPDDGLFADGEDMNPFDYKVLTIEVTAPSQFTGKETKHADFKTYLAREGASSAITGVMVKVVRGWTDENANRIPVEGVLVSLEDSGAGNTAPYASGVTNIDGIAMIPVNFANENHVYSYKIELDYPGMIPNPNNQKLIEARPYETKTITLEMDKPATLNVVFAPALNNTSITLNGLNDKINITKHISKGMTSVTFGDLWPTGNDGTKSCEGGSYNIESDDMLIYSLELGAGTNMLGESEFEFYQPSTENIKNLWMYYDDLEGKGAHWRAAKTNYSGEKVNYHSEAEHRMATKNAIDLTKYKAKNGAEITNLIANFSLEVSGYPTTPPNIFPYSIAYIATSDTSLDSNTGWEPFLSINRSGNSRILVDTNGFTVAPEKNFALKNPNDITFPNNFSKLDQPFCLRFDSNPSWSNFVFTWNRLDIYCAYEKSGIDFRESGDYLTLLINGQ